MNEAAASPSVPPALWPELSRLFDEALALPAGERSAWLAALQARAPELAHWLQRLLAAHEGSAALQGPAPALLAAALHAPQFQAGQQFGIYRLTSPLGRGGMAQVWRARQLQGVQRDVALKLPDTRIEAPAALAERFARERDLLATLEHPHIARLYDAGVAEGDQPFLAMELVQGLPLIEHATQQALGVPARLALFLQVLDAVAFAHRRLVIHRDLKPSNILVDGSGQARLLDFGIARLLSEEPAAGGASQGSAFTPDGAAPEQLAGQALGPASDVYALGVVLYELLSGRRPYRLDRTNARPLAEQLAARDVAPLPESDLQAITAKAMRLEPEARYASADALADDIRRHLQQRPVLARGDAMLYVSGRFVQRHRVAVLAAACVLLALTAGAGVALWQAQQAREQAARATAVQGLLLGLFDGASPEQRKNGNPADLVLRGAERAERGLQAQPLLRADLLAAAGRLLNKLQAWGPAADKLRQALQLYDSLGRGGEAQAIEARFWLQEALQNRGDAEAALQEADRVLALGRALQGEGHAWALRTGVQRGNILVRLGRAQDALAQFEALRSMGAAAGVDLAHQRLLALNGEGDALLDLGRFDEARQRFEQVLQQAPSVPAFERTDVLSVRYNLNSAAGMAGDLASVVERGRPLVADALAHLGPNAGLTRNARNQLAQALAIRGHFAEAVAVQREVLAVAEATPGIAEEDVQHQRGALAVMLAAAGQPAEGLPLARATVAAGDRRWPTVTPLREAWRVWLGTVELRSGLFDASAATLAQAAANLATLPGHPLPRWADATQLQALAERARGKPDVAAQLLEAACAAYKTGAGPGALSRLRCQAHRAWLAAEAAPGEAARAQSLEQAVNAYLAQQRPEHVAHAEWLLMQAGLRSGAEAAALQSRGEQAWQQAMGLPWRGPLTGLR